MAAILGLLKNAVALGASDLHLTPPNTPVLRIDGILNHDDEFGPVSPQDVIDILAEIATPKQLDDFNREHELDFVYEVPGLARFRVNVQQQRGMLSMVFRCIPFQVPSIDEFGLPPILKDLVMKPRGLIVVTGPTGSGKSTTLAAMVNHLNQNSEGRVVITIEDPIEYTYKDDLCVISQRELGSDTDSFAKALKHALRHDPDVIVVGEMRDLETMSTAIAAAETGHLVLGTLHTIDAPQTVDRMIDMFPPQQHQQVRMQFSQVLVAVISQALVHRASGKGRVGAFEIMLATSAVCNLIREGKTFELPNVMQMSAKDGMQILDKELANLVKEGVITEAEALRNSSHPDRLKKLSERIPLEIR